MPTTKERATDIGYRGYKAFINKIWYPFLTRRLDTQDVTFLNYGYEDEPPLNLPLDENDAPNRYSINLYHQVANQVDLTGKKVLEASCGTLPSTPDWTTTRTASPTAVSTTNCPA
jgi:hypothetical protein